MGDEYVWPDPVESPRADLLRTGQVSPAVGKALAPVPNDGSTGEYDARFTVDGFPVESCRSCGAPIVWATTPDGKNMPVDGPLSADGNVVLQRPPAPVTTDKIYAVVLDQPGLFDDGPRHVSHFATCPDADTWRSERVGSR